MQNAETLAVLNPRRGPLVPVSVAKMAPRAHPQPQRNFASVEDAVSAFVAALRDHKMADLRAILGPEGDRVIDSGDRYADQELQSDFVALYDTKHTIDQNEPRARRAGCRPGRLADADPAGREQWTLGFRH